MIVINSKRLIYFLMVLSVCGLIASGTAHAQINGIGGTISNPDGTPVVGVTVAAPGFGNIPVTPTTGANGYYFIPYTSFANIQIRVGDKITVQVTDAEGNVITERTHTVNRADVDAGVATFDITLGSTVSPPPQPFIYWTGYATGKIQRANLDGSNVQDLLTPTQGLSNPSSITLDVVAGKMYWTDWGTGKIQRANLDGSNVQDLVTQGLEWLRGMDLDVAGGKMYWTDGRAHKIQRANLDGSNVQDLVTGLSSPYGIALDAGSGKMYWTNGGANKIQRANLDGSNVQDLVTTQGLGAPYALALDVVGGKMYWTHLDPYSNTGKIQRADLDGSNVQDLVTQGSSRPYGIALDAVGGQMYWTDELARKIQRANLDGSNVQDLVTGLQSPWGVAIGVQAIPPPFSPGSEVNIPDRNLRAAIEKALGKASGATITTAEMASLTRLDAPNANISNLTGLEHATNLTELSLDDNNISDLSPLVSNAGLGSGDKVNVRGNPLNAVSINTHIPTLQGRGVEVQFDEPPSTTTTVSVSPASVQSPSIGGQLTVSLKIVNGADVAGYQATVAFDTTALRYKESADGDYLPAGAFFVPLTGSGNQVTVASTALSGESSGDGTLATLTFEVVAVKASTLTLSEVVLSDSAGVGSRPQVENGQITRPPQGRAVNIPDPNLRAKIEETLGKASGATITTAEMASLTRLDAPNANISNLTGLEGATNLTRLDLGFVYVQAESRWFNSNSASNLSPLSGLTNLTILTLSGNTISNISPLAGLTNLTQLRLFDNSISDLSPLVGLTNLRHLDLGVNNISDISALSGLTNLTWLRLWQNNISDISALSGLTNLTNLRLQINKIVDISSLSRLTNLTYLNLQLNKIVDISSLSGLTNLTYLNLWQNKVSNISSLSGLTNLTNLGLNLNNISDLSPLVSNAGLGSGDTVDVRRNPLNAVSVNTHIPTLRGRGVEVLFDPPQTVHIPDTNLRAAIERALGKASGATITTADMGTLTRLDALNANISNLTGLEYATNLTELRLSGNNISDISAVSGLTNLTRLHLYGNNITNISAIAGLTNLTSLDILNNPISSDISALTRLTNLTELRLSGNNISDISPVSSLTNLTRLHLSGSNISDISPVSSLTNLASLILGGNISDISTVSGLSNLTQLGLYSNTTITNISLVSGLTNLTWLDLGYNNLSDISALSGLTNLTQLGLNSTSISDISTVSGLTNLTELHLGSNNISDISAVSRLTHLTYLNLGSNSISDISALVSNTGLGSGDKVNVRGNPLNATAINTHIPTLQGRGVEVQFDAPPPSRPVNIPDANLRAKIETALGKASGATITTADMATLTRLDAPNANISNLTGLEGATNLTELSLSNNSISDLSPLVSNTGLGSGDKVNVRGNPLSTQSITTHILTLQSRGVEVLFDAPSSTSTTVSVSPGSVESPSIGGQLTVSLKIANGQNVAGYQATVAFDTTALRYKESADGDYLPAGAFFVPLTGSGNQVTVASTALSGESSGDGTLATLTFEVVAVKASTLTLSEVVLSDGAGIGSRPQVENGQITKPPQGGAGPDLETNALIIEGTITHIDGTPAAGLDVTVTIGSNSQTTVSKNDGSYNTIVFDPANIVASTGDTVKVEVFQETGELLASETVQLSSEQILATKVIIDLQVSSDLETRTLIVEGTITHIDGTPAAGLDVTVTIGSNSQTTVSKNDGSYNTIVFDPANIVASTGDTVKVEVFQETGELLASETVQLSSEQILAIKVIIDLQVSSDIKEFLLSVPTGTSLIHVPLKVTAVNDVPQTLTSVADFYDALGGAETVNYLATYDHQTNQWNSYLGESSRGTEADPVLTEDKGILAVLKEDVTLRLSGDALGTNGTSSITLQPGTNVVGLPLKSPNITRVSDLFTLDGIRDNVTSITVVDNGEFKTVSQAGDDGDIEITGGQGFSMEAQRSATVTIVGKPWTNNGAIGAAPTMAITSIEVGDTTPVLALRGSVVDEETGLNEPRFRVTIKNLSNRRTITGMTKDERGGYQLTWVDIKKGRAAAIEDILEISAQSPNPFIGVQPLRHTVTAEDVKKSLIQLPNLITYEIPTETQLLRNYPNPFNPETWIPYRLAEDAFVKLTIYDVTGQVVRTLDVGHRIAAVYESRSKAIYWDSRNHVGEQVASGVYFYHLQAGDFSATRRMVILK